MPVMSWLLINKDKPCTICGRSLRGLLPASKYCLRCKKIKLSKRTEYRRKYQIENRDKYRKNQAKFAKQNKEAIKSGALKCIFGITKIQYDEILQQQKGVCGICKQPPNKDRHLSVDHDHKTGQIRGLLHAKCNSSLGGLGDSIKGLQRAINYLRHPTDFFIPKKKLKHLKRSK